MHPSRALILALVLTALVPARALAAPADKTAPKLTGPLPTAFYFSPNGDGVRDGATVVIRVSEPGRLTALVLGPTGRTVATLAKSRSVAAGSAKLVWAGRAGGKRRPDGTYRLRVWLTDRAGNKAKRWPATSSLIIDTRRPRVTPAGVAPTPFSPNGDGARDRTSLTVKGNEALSGTLKVFAGDEQLATRGASGGRTLSATWDGKDDQGRVAADGVYRMVLSVRDRAGNPGTQVRGDTRLDLTPPRMTVTLSDTTVSPNADGTQDAVHVAIDLQEAAASLVRRTLAPSGRRLSSFSAVPAPSGSYETTFDGLINADASEDGSRETSLATGGYKITVVAADSAGNKAVQTKTVAVVSYTLVVLDPGHGGMMDKDGDGDYEAYDTGAVGFSAFDPRYREARKLLESVLNLQVANGRRDGTATVQRGVAQFLRETTAAGQEIRVRLTRTQEREPGLTLDKRAYIANYYAPAVFMVIHNNDASNPNAIGTETLYDPASARSKYLAQRVQAHVAARIAATGANPGWVNRGLKDGSWLRLAKLVTVPMALVEGGFVNNRVENRLLRTDAYREAIAKGVSEGVVDYLNQARKQGWT